MSLNYWAFNFPLTYSLLFSSLLLKLRHSINSFWGVNWQEMNLPKKTSDIKGGFNESSKVSHSG